MSLLIKPATAILLMTVIAFPTLKEKGSSQNSSQPITTNQSPKIQAAILLDVSNSMDGLIDQAKAQLWNIVSVMGKAKCNEAIPQIEIALYEYGRDSNDPSKGYVKQISGFTKDLDQLSKDLFNLTTNGGSEFCGQVIYSSLGELNWDTAATSYKVIFIAGNEDFLQGNLTYTEACKKAREKGVIVNTIYCGDKMQGIREHWNLGSECGTGSFTNIDQNESPQQIPTPFDSTLIVLNQRLNGTYIGYGSFGAENTRKQEEVDQLNTTMNKSVMANRVAVKGKAGLYKNTSWDLVDARAEDSTIISKVDLKTLPEKLQNLSRKELDQLIKEKTEERRSIQKEIETVNASREIYIVNELNRNNQQNKQTLGSEVEKIIKKQAALYNMIIQ